MIDPEIAARVYGPTTTESLQAMGFTFDCGDLPADALPCRPPQCPPLQDITIVDPETIDLNHWSTWTGRPDRCCNDAGCP